MGRRFFGRVSMRLQEAKGNSLPFGGIDVMITGDAAQLPPVKDKPKYDGSDNLKNVEPEVTTGFNAYKDFETVVFLDRAYRQRAEDGFYEMLQRLRQGEQTEADWRMLRKRELGRLSADERVQFSSGTSVRFYSTILGSDTHNAAKLAELGVPTVRLFAVHTGVGAEGVNMDDYNGLEPLVTLAVGARVRLRFNDWVTKGIFNGALGWVRGIVYKDGDHPSDRSVLPAAVIVEVDGYTGPGYKGLERHVAVPVSTVSTYNWSTRSPCTRSQVPLALGWSMTIHKCQGMTVGTGQPITHMTVDVGNLEHAAGMSFVAYSRAKALEAMAVDPAPNLDRFMRAGKGLQVVRRKAQEDVLRRRAALTRARYPAFLESNHLDIRQIPPAPAPEDEEG